MIILALWFENWYFCMWFVLKCLENSIFSHVFILYTYLFIHLSFKSEIFKIFNDRMILNFFFVF